jgi:hypothetical protein
MPWELGYFDGRRGSAKVAIFPIVATASEQFSGFEYLGLYAWVEAAQLTTGGRGLGVLSSDRRTVRTVASLARS